MIMPLIRKLEKAELWNLNMKIKEKNIYYHLWTIPILTKKTISLIPKGHEDLKIIDISFKATKPGDTSGKDYYLRLGKED